MRELDPVLIQEFAAEVIEHIESSERVLVRASTEPVLADDINLLFRGFHSVKGLARVISFTGLEQLAHVAESLLAAIRDGKHELDGATQDLLLQTVDGVRQARLSLLQGVPFKADERLLIRLEAALASGARGRAGTDFLAPAELCSDLYFDTGTLVALGELFAELLPPIGAALAGGAPGLNAQVQDDIGVLEFALDKLGLRALQRSVSALASERAPVQLAHCLYLVQRFAQLMECQCGVDETLALARPWLVPGLSAALAQEQWGDAGWLMRMLLPHSPFVALLPQLLSGSCAPATRQTALTTLAETLGAELASGGSSADLSAMAADRVRELLAQPHRAPDGLLKFLDARGLDLERVRSLPPPLLARLLAVAAQPQSDFLEIIVEQPAQKDLLPDFACQACASLELIFTDSVVLDGVPCMVLLVTSDLSAEALSVQVQESKWACAMLAVRKLDRRQGSSHFSGKVLAAPPEVAGGGMQVRVPVALLDSMFGRVGQFFGVVTRFNAMVSDAEVPDILRELSDYGVLHAPHLLPKVDRLIRQQNDYVTLEAETHRLISMIHEMTLGLRVIPLDTLFSRFPRMVRDTAQKQGKLVRFEAKSNGIRVDNGMLELLADPLMHMLRNCVDHGIELPDVREQAGKARSATLTLSGEQRGNRILIEACDDGSGIDIERVLRKAIANDLVTAEQGAMLTPEQIARFIFSPGFSTAEQVTDTSGRGVGMDVALVNVTKLGGKIDILTRPGKGTTFRIDIPLSKAIQPMLLAETGLQNVAFPDRMVTEGMISPADAVQFVNGQRAILLHERFLPLFRLVDLLQLPAPPFDAAAELSIIVCELEGRRIGVEVKRILRRTDLLIQEMHPRISHLPGIGGISTLGTDKIVVVVDPEGLFDLARRFAVFGLRTHETRVVEGMF